MVLNLWPKLLWRWHFILLLEGLKKCSYQIHHLTGISTYLFPLGKQPGLVDCMYNFYSSCLYHPLYLVGGGGGFLSKITQNYQTYHDSSIYYHFYNMHHPQGRVITRFLLKVSENKQ